MKKHCLLEDQQKQSDVNKPEHLYDIANRHKNIPKKKPVLEAETP